MSSDLLYGAMPIQDSSIKDELVLYGEMTIQDSFLKYELVLRHSPSKFIVGHCNISLTCVCLLLINASFLMAMYFFNYIPTVLPPCKRNLVNFTFYKIKMRGLQQIYL